MEQVELIHDIDLDEKRRKKKRERQEEKLKKTAPPTKKNRVPLDTMSGLSTEEKSNISLDFKESKIEQELEFKRRERKKEHNSLQELYEKMRQEELARLAAYKKAKQDEIQRRATKQARKDFEAKQKLEEEKAQ